MSTATEGDEWYYHADHVIRRLIEELEKGTIPEKRNSCLVLIDSEIGGSRSG